MAILHCLECKEKVSSTARACPHCGATEYKPRDEFFVNLELARSFVVNTVPKELFKKTARGMFASLTLEEVEKLGGPSVVAAIKSGKADSDGFRQLGDLDDFWLRYNPTEVSGITFELSHPPNVVIINSIRLTGQAYTDELRSIYRKYELPNVENILDRIEESIAKWWKG